MLTSRYGGAAVDWQLRFPALWLTAMAFLSDHPLLLMLVAILIGLSLGWVAKQLAGRRREARLLNDWQRRLSAAEDETFAKRDEAHRHAAALALLRTQHDNASLRLETLQTTANKYNAKMSRLNVELDDAKDKLRQARSGLAERDGAIVELQQAVDELKAISDPLEQRVASQETELKKLRLDRDDWLSKTNHYRSDLNGKVSSLVQADKQVAKLTEELSLKEADIQSRDATLNQLQRQFDNAGELLTDLKQQVSEREQSIAQLEQQVAELDQHWQARLTRHDEQNTELRDELQRWQQRVPKLEKALGKQDKLVSTTRHQLDKTSNQQSTLEAQIAERDRKISELDAALTTYRKQLKPLQRRLARREAELDQLQGELTLGPADERPTGLFINPPKTQDDLKQIKGIGSVLEDLLHQRGIYRFDQIADFSAADLRWLDDHLGKFRGRARRDRWVAQAKRLRTQPSNGRQF